MCKVNTSFRVFNSLSQIYVKYTIKTNFFIVLKTISTYYKY